MSSIMLRRLQIDRFRRYVAEAVALKRPVEVVASPTHYIDRTACSFRVQDRFRRRPVSGKRVWEYEAASPVTSSPAVAMGKVVVATADGQVICFG